MNRVNFLAQTHFPADSETWDFMQQMIVAVQNLSALGGSTNYILSGCTGTSSISSGYVVINGEILPFEAGIKSTYIIVAESKEDINYRGTNYPGLYVKRTARFGSGSPQYLWSSFKRITNLLDVANEISNINTNVNSIARIPVGIINPFAGSTIPTGWLPCDGRLLSAISYNNLYMVIGNTYGGSGISFNLPDLRGRFIVGAIQENDSDYKLGNKGGEEFHKLTVSEMPSHQHGIKNGGGGSGTGKSQRSLPNNNWPAESLINCNTEFQGGPNAHENRPPYFALNYIIKY